MFGFGMSTASWEVAVVSMLHAYGSLIEHIRGTHGQALHDIKLDPALVLDTMTKVLAREKFKLSAEQASEFIDLLFHVSLEPKTFNEAVLEFRKADPTRDLDAAWKKASAVMIDNASAIPHRVKAERNRKV